jgi:polysaccharide biosynthesis transport protein
MGQISFNEASFVADGIRFDLIEVMRLLWRRKWLLLFCGLGGALLGVAVSLLLAPRYQAEGNLVVRSEAFTAPDTERAFEATAVNEAVVTTEQEVLTSKGLLTRVAQQLNIPPEFLPKEDLFQRLRAALESTDLIDRGWFDRLVPPAHRSADAELERKTKFVSSSITTSAAKGSSVITVRAVTRDRQLSEAIVNSMMQLYMQDRSNEESRTARLIEEALRQRLRQTHLQIDHAESQLVQMLQQPGAIETSETPGLKQRMTLIGDKLIDAQAELARRQADYEAAVQLRDGKGSPDANSEVIQKLREQLALLQAGLARTQATHGGRDFVRAQLAQIQSLQKQITSEVARVVAQRKAELSAAQATVTSLRMQADREREERQNVSSTIIGLTGQRDAVASLWRTSDALDARLIDLAAHPTSLNARILSFASAPILPSFPSKALFAACGALLAGMTAVGSLLFATQIRSRAPMAIQIADTMNTPLLGTLPPTLGLRSSARQRLLGSPTGGKDLRAANETLSAIALELDDAVKDNRLHSVTVTSARSGEGKTTVATALARSLASMSLRVMLIDLDLRHPSAESAFLASAPNSLEPHRLQINPETVLDVRVDRKSGLHIWTPFPDGCEDPLSYLRSASLSQIIGLLRHRYDLLVIDTPPIMAVPDGLVAAKLSDAIVVVAELSRNSHIDAAEMSRRLTGTQRAVFGVVVTKVTGDISSYNGYAG